MTSQKRSIDKAAYGESERRLPALAVSRGVGIGRVMFLHGDKTKSFRIDLDPAEVGNEIMRLQNAVESSLMQLRALAANDHPDPSQPVSSIFGVHQLILEESSIVEKIKDVIREDRVNTEWALKVVSDQYLERQRTVADEHLREKYLDIEDVAGRLLTALSGTTSTAQYSGTVVVACELRPSAIMEFSASKPAALITEHGGWTSHASILAREFRLPMVSGLKNLDQKLSHGDPVIVDGINGEVIVNPSEQTIERFRGIRADILAPDGQPDDEGKSAVMLDGTRIVIRANVDIPEAYQLAKHFGAEGIGLFRSESLIKGSGMIPSEDEQVAAYSHMASIAGEAGLKIRTFDIGVERLGDDPAVERNPSLGLRSIRLSFANPVHFRAQIRAILRASSGRKIDIVLPMISGVQEVMRSRSIIDEERHQLIKGGFAVGDPQVGAMIEVPSSVLMVREIVKRVDFLCLGTNDLVQYLLAVDRDNDAVADWYQSLHPAVIRAIGDVLSAADEVGMPAVVCGEMAGSQFYVPLLIGVGARELSMNFDSIPPIRYLLSGMTIEQAVGLVNTIKPCETANEIESLLREYYLANWSDLFSPGLLESKHR